MRRKSKWFNIALLLGVVVLLSACRASAEPLSEASIGIWDYYILYNMSRFIIWLSNLFGGNYGIGIIIFTVIIRIVLLPLNKIQAKSQREMQELQPELKAIQEKYPNKDRESMEKMQEEQQALMEERGVNQFAGCLPLLIQLPVMMALYQSILRTEVLRAGDFLWVNLGQRDPYFILPIVAALFAFASSYFMQLSNPVSNAQTKMMTYTMPVMILLVTINLPSAITLYLTITNIFTVLQTFLFNNPYKIIREREEKEAAEKARKRELKRALRRATGKKK